MPCVTSHCLLHLHNVVEIKAPSGNSQETWFWRPPRDLSEVTSGKVITEAGEPEGMGCPSLVGG